VITLLSIVVTALFKGRIPFLSPN